MNCEDENSKLVEVVTVTHVDDDKCADNSYIKQLVSFIAIKSTKQVSELVTKVDNDQTQVY